MIDQDLKETKQNISDIISSWTLEQKIGQLFFPAAYFNATPGHIEEIKTLITGYHIGGLSFFHSQASAAANYEKGQEIKFNPDSIYELVDLINAYQNAADFPLLICVDAEWGLAMRVEETPQFPYAMTLGAVQDDEMIFSMGKAIASHCRRVGIHLNFAPVADINNNPRNPVIGYRSFGEQPEEVIAKMSAYLKGQQAGGLLSCVKHYPGHGDTDTDSHLALPLVPKSIEGLEAMELRPFAAAIQQGVESVMTGHIGLPGLQAGEEPASLSQELIIRQLRNKMGFEGLVMTDALNMKSVANMYSPGELELKALVAGNDVLLYSEHIPTAVQRIQKAVEEGELNESIIDEKCYRVLEAKSRVGLSDYKRLPETSRQHLREDLFTDQIHAMQEELAASALTCLKEGKVDLTKAALVSIGPRQDRVFEEKIAKKYRMPAFMVETAAQIVDEVEALDRFDSLIIACFVPSMKPGNDFGLSGSLRKVLAELIRTKECTLYFFGNPYALKLFPNLEKAHGLVVLYQDSPYLQKAAAGHLLGEIKSQGKLPVSVEPYFEAGQGILQV